MKKLNAQVFEERSDTMFANSYITSTGITQNVALALIIIVLFQDDNGALFKESWAVSLAQAAVAFAVILLIVEEYTWWLLLMRRTPNLLDTAIPYTVGLWELTAIACISRRSEWWWWAMSLLCLFGIFAYFNSRWHCMKRAGREDQFEQCLWVRERVIRHIDEIMVMVGFSGLITLTVWLFRASIIPQVQAGVAVGLALLVTGMMAKSAFFLRDVRQKFSQAGTAPPREPSN
jgi:hypothetical protein